MPDKPGHILEISDALGRDVDRAAAGKIAPPPVEAFLSDVALREIERATKARDEPVRADQLHPITRGQAASRTTFDGERLPRAPSMRRVIPAPFQRPRIEIGAHGKTWQFVSIDEVAEGDIVPDVGRVVSVTEHVVRARMDEILDPEIPDPRMLIEQAWIAEDFPAGLQPPETVAVGTVILLTGLGGQVRAFRPGSQVQVFRKT